MPLLTAIHRIERGRKSTPSSVAPGTTFKAEDGEVKDLIALRAARLATDGEAELFAKNDAPAAAATVITSTGESVATREVLEARANELGVKFSANLGDEKLAERVAEAEAAKIAADAAATSGDNLV